MKQTKEILGVIMLLIPLISTFIVLYWAENMTMPYFWTVIAGTFILSGILAGAERAWVNAGAADEEKKSGVVPILWALLVMLVWIIGYPAYLAVRSKYGLKNMVAGGIFVGLAFVISASIVGTAIAERSAAIRHDKEALEEIRQFRDVFPKSESE